MNRLWTLGVAAMVAFAAACGDDDSGPGSVALFTDTLHFDYDTLVTGSEASELEHTIRSFGINIIKIPDVDSATIAGALRNTRILVIPESFSSFNAAVTAPVLRAMIRDWVDSTGGLLIVNHNTTNRLVLDSLFGYTLATGVFGDRYFLDATDAAGTPLANGPGTIWDVSAVTELAAASLPAGTLSIYATAGGDLTVGLVPQGNGRVLLLGWDWFDAHPFGTQDGGWIEVLQLALKL